MFDSDSRSNRRNMFGWNSRSNKRITQSIRSGHLRRPRPYAQTDIPPPPSYTSPSAEGVRRYGSAQSRLCTTPNDDKPLGIRKPSLPESEPLPYSASRSLASAIINDLSRRLERTRLAEDSFPIPASTLLPAQSDGRRRW